MSDHDDNAAANVDLPPGTKTNAWRRFMAHLETVEESITSVAFVKEIYGQKTKAFWERTIERAEIKDEEQVEIVLGVLTKLKLVSGGTEKKKNGADPKAGTAKMIALHGAKFDMTIKHDPNNPYVVVSRGGEATAERESVRRILGSIMTKLAPLGLKWGKMLKSAHGKALTAHCVYYQPKWSMTHLEIYSLYYNSYGNHRKAWRLSLPPSHPQSLATEASDADDDDDLKKKKKKKKKKNPKKSKKDNAKSVEVHAQPEVAGEVPDGPEFGFAWEKIKVASSPAKAAKAANAANAGGSDADEQAKNDDKKSDHDESDEEDKAKKKKAKGKKNKSAEESDEEDKAKKKKGKGKKNKSAEESDEEEKARKKKAKGKKNKSAEVSDEEESAKKKQDKAKRKKSAEGSEDEPKKKKIKAKKSEDEGSDDQDRSKKSKRKRSADGSDDDAPLKAKKGKASDAQSNIHHFFSSGEHKGEPEFPEDEPLDEEVAAPDAPKAKSKRKGKMKELCEEIVRMLTDGRKLTCWSPKVGLPQFGPGADFNSLATVVSSGRAVPEATEHGFDRPWGWAEVSGLQYKAGNKDSVLFTAKSKKSWTCATYIDEDSGPLPVHTLGDMEKALKAKQPVFIWVGLLRECWELMDWEDA